MAWSGIPDGVMIIRFHLLIGILDPSRSKGHGSDVGTLDEGGVFLAPDSSSYQSLQCPLTLEPDTRHSGLDNDHS
jgi:hypothetical protein